MRNCLRLSAAYIKWNLLSWYTFVAIILYAAMMFVSVFTDYIYGFNEGAYYFLMVAHISRYYELIPVICAIPSALIFAREIQNRRLQYVYYRCGKRQYSISLVIAVAVSSFIIAVAGSALFLGIIAARYPLTGGNPNIFENCAESLANGALIAEGRYFEYYLLTVFSKAALSSGYAVSVTFASIITEDKFISVIVPFAAFHIIGDFLARNDCFRLINPTYIYNSSNYVIRSLQPDYVRNFSVLSAAYPFIFMLVVIIVFAVFSHFLIKRKVDFGHSQ